MSNLEAIIDDLVEPCFRCGEKPEFDTERHYWHGREDKGYWCPVCDEAHCKELRRWNDVAKAGRGTMKDAYEDGVRRGIFGIHGMAQDTFLGSFDDLTCGEYREKLFGEWLDKHHASKIKEWTK